MSERVLIQARVDKKTKEDFAKKAGKGNASYVLKKLVKGYNSGEIKV